ncbi:MAG: hypothetical protein DRH37_02900 [Deltaproteobacteria bacterium]|nr:MAG: hypothetical protein DRH37_02900 [Deltaproteobacteria bacterium]
MNVVDLIKKRILVKKVHNAVESIDSNKLGMIINNVSTEIGTYIGSYGCALLSKKNMNTVTEFINDNNDIITDVMIDVLTLIENIKRSNINTTTIKDSFNETINYMENAVNVMSVNIVKDNKELSIKIMNEWNEAFEC